jgi:8-oxo-dGTP pyrophosphatase MutT (NUDIX family)
MMISFDVGETMKFNMRSAGLLVLDDRILFQRFADRDWWFLPGGRVEMMEDSHMAEAAGVQGIKANREDESVIVDWIFESRKWLVMENLVNSSRTPAGQTCYN